jgi:hypothetical protein
MTGPLDHYFAPAPDAADDGETVCLQCGHRAFSHTRGVNEPGDCLHRNPARRSHASATARARRSRRFPDDPEE